MANKIDNYLNKGGDWSDDELLIPSDNDNDNNNNGNSKNNKSYYSSSEGSSDDDSDGRRYSRGGRLSRRHYLHSNERKAKANKDLSHYPKQNKKVNVYSNDLILTEKNSNVDYYKTNVTDMEMAGARARWRYY